MKEQIILLVVAVLILFTTIHITTNSWVEKCKKKGGVPVGMYQTDCWVEGKGFIN